MLCCLLGREMGAEYEGAFSSQFEMGDGHEIMSAVSKRARLASPAAGSLAEITEDEQEPSDREGSESDEEEEVEEEEVERDEEDLLEKSSSSQLNDVSTRNAYVCDCGKSFQGILQLSGHKGRCDVFATLKYGAPYTRNADAAKNKQQQQVNMSASVSVPNGMNLVTVEPLAQNLMALESAADAVGGVRNLHESDGDMGESRNNLYWNHKRGEACLWYGSDEVGRFDMIEVLPFFQKCGSGDVIVKRADIVPLDGVYCQRYQDIHHRAFCLALLDFPEWDDNQRISYVWSSTLINIIHLSDAFDEFRKKIYSLGLNRKDVFHDDLEKMYLFSLCALHSGFLESCTVDVLLSDDDNSSTATGGGDNRITTNPDITQLYRTVLKMKDNQEKSFRRSASRCGYDFQVPCIPAEYPEEAKICVRPSRSESVNHDNDEKEIIKLLEGYKNDGLIHSAVDQTSLTTEATHEYVEKMMAVPLVLPGCLVSVELLSRNNYGGKDKQEDSYGIVTRIRFADSGPTSESDAMERMFDVFKNANALTLSQIKDKAKDVMLTIYDGKRSFSASAEDVKVCGKIVDIDTSLEILRNAKYDTERAFVAMFDLFKKHINCPSDFIWNKDQFDSFLTAAKAVKKDNAWKCYQQYKKNYKKRIACGDLFGDEGVELTGPEKEKSFKVIFDVYERMFHEKPEQENSSDEGAMHLNSSKTYMSQDSQDSQSSNLALPSRQVGSSPAAKLKSPSTVPLNESDPHDGDDDEVDDMDMDDTGDTRVEGCTEENDDYLRDQSVIVISSSSEDGRYGSNSDGE